MSIIKKVFYGICILVMFSCLGMLVCALNPSMTRSVADILYGEGAPGEGGILGFIDLLKEEAEDVMAQGNGDVVYDPESGLRLGNISYVMPSEENMTLPESVNGRNGYKPIQGEWQEVSDTDIDSLQSSLTTGDVGEELAFDAAYYPYYGMLESDMQTLYRQIYANAMSLTKSFAPAVEVSATKLKNVFEAVYNDHPELFWLDTSYSCKYTRSGQCVEISLQYNSTVNDLEEAKSVFEAKAESILNGAGSLSDSYAKERYVHDALISLVDYNTGASMNQSAYSALINGKTVCAGYARTYQYLLQQLNIPCYYCTGYSGQNHAWNIVLLDGVYYNVDVTWDDTEPSTYDYFNKSDQEFAATHVRKGLSVYLPACAGGSYSGLESGAPEIVEPEESGNYRSPLTLADYQKLWDSLKGTSNSSDLNGHTPTQEEAEGLRKAGLSASEVLWNLDAYYADCLEQTKREGAGERLFTNVVPASLWAVIERQYTNGEYEKGYSTKTLNELNKSSFSILIQAQDLSGGYYRIYHYTSIY